ncbi:hypothetical protein MPER_06153 [Moniliophthora perniciosa FA553]|nr:hypothetical protein MPER_06153 [Moniliophthora perniciosa FA553]
MHARHSKEAWARSAVPPERLKLFLEDSRAHAPKVRNTWLDKAGKTTTKELRESSWNQALIHKLALLLKDIVAQCPDKTRFGNGNIDWKALVSNRFDQIYLDIVQSVPRNEAETRSPAMIQTRLEMRNLEKNIANGAVTIRNAKYHARMNIAANMAGYQRE